MDQTLTHWINALSGHSAVLDALLVLITKYGVPVAVLAVMAQWWTKVERPSVRHAAISAGCSFLLGLAVNQVILMFIHRTRPYESGLTHLLIEPSADWSFPSDHATAAFAAMASFLLAGLYARAAVLAALAILVCWSRIYVGTHYLTDVLGGALTGIAAALAVSLVYRKDTALDRKLTGIF